jgi:hypothetical protein
VFADILEAGGYGDSPLTEVVTGTFASHTSWAAGYLPIFLFFGFFLATFIVY